MDDYDDFDDDDEFYELEHTEEPSEPKPSLKELAVLNYRKVEPYLPLIPLAISVKNRSPYWAMVAALLHIAIRPRNNHISIVNCHLTGGGSSPVVLVK